MGRPRQTWGHVMLSTMLTRKEQVILLAVAGSVLLGAVALFVHHTSAARPQPVALEQATAAGTPDTPSVAADAKDPPLTPVPPAPASEPQQVAVSVRGAVNAPGVYEFESGARVEDALERAGGMTETADLTDINLAARLRDGTTLHVPPRPEPSSPNRRDPWFSAAYNPPEYTITGSGQGQSGDAGAPARSSTAPAAGGDAGRIDLNTASQPALESLPGIGPSLAQRIIRHREARPFKTVDEVQNVSGIGPKRLAAIRNLVTVSGG